MKISTLLSENITPASAPTNNTQAPVFGRSEEFLEDEVKEEEQIEETTSGAIASVAQPVGGVQRRGKGSIFAGVKTSKKFYEQVSEGYYNRYNRRDAYQRDYDASVAGMGKRDSLAYQLDGGANDEGWDEPQRSYQQRAPKPVAKKGYYFYNVPAGQEMKAQEVGLFRTKTGKWYSPFQNTRADMFFGTGRFWAPKNESVNEGQSSDLRTWQVVIMNNYYRGKYTDYSGRYYYVLASSPEEARRVVLDNSDAILQDLLSMKSVTGRRILPRSSAIPITDKRIGDIKDGTEAGRMTTAGFKRMFGPQGPMMVKLTNGAVTDVQEQGVSEDTDPCWDNYKQIGMKMKNGKSVPNCVPKESVEEGSKKSITPEQMIHDAVEAYKKEAAKENPNPYILDSIRTNINDIKREIERKKQGVAEGQNMPDANGNYKFHMMAFLRNGDIKEFNVIANGDRNAKILAKKKLIEKGYTKIDSIHIQGMSPVHGPVNYEIDRSKRFRLESQGVAEGDDRGDYHATARLANQASRTAKSRQDHAKAADLHSRAATYALSAGQDQSVIHDHQMAAWEHNRASKGLKEQGVAEDWQKVNKSDKTDGMSPKAVKAYRRENPGSKLKTAVTKKPSELKAGSKDAKRRKSFCARMSGNPGPMKDEKGRPTPKAKALARWNCNEGEEPVNEKSVSKAQFRTMAAAAHNPEFAKKVGISSKVAKEFHKADKKANYKSLPSKVDEAELSEEQLLAKELQKRLDLFKKGPDKDLGDKPKNNDVQKKVDEVSSELLGRYKTAASKEASELDKQAFGGDKDAAKKIEKANKRFSGIVKATNKQFANDMKKHK